MLCRYNESVHRKEQHQVELIRFRKKIHVYFCKARNSTQLPCLRLDSCYSISLFDSNDFNYP